MTNPRHTCRGCSFFKAMGDKGFCFKHSKLLKKPEACEDFTPITKDSLKKRKIIDPGEKIIGAKIEGIENVKIVEKPIGSKGFELTKKATIKNKLFTESPNQGDINIPLTTKDTHNGQNIFLIIIIGAILILITFLFLTGLI